MRSRIATPSKVSLCVAVFIAVCQFAPFLAQDVARHLGWVHEPLPGDFPTFYYAAVLYRSGRNPYDLAVLANCGKIMDIQIFPFLYPPTSLPAFSPLALGAIDASLLAFQAIGFLCLIYVLFVVIRTAEREQWPTSWRQMGLLALASFSAIYLTFRNGQVNIVATAAMLFAWVRARENLEGYEAACAAALLITTLLKTYPVLLVLLFLIHRDFKVIAWFVLFTVADALLSYFTVQHGAWHSWTADVMPTGRFGVTPFGLFPPSAVWNQSLNGALSRTLGEGTTARIGIFLQAVVLGLTALVCWTSRRQGRRRFYDLGFGTVVVATFLIAPLSWFHHFVFLIPALAAFASILNLTEWRDSIGWKATLLLVTFMISAGWPQIRSDSRAALALMTLPISGPLALFAMFIILSFAPSVAWRFVGPEDTLNTAAR